MLVNRLTPLATTCIVTYMNNTPNTTRHLVCISHASLAVHSADTFVSSSAPSQVVEVEAASKRGRCTQCGDNATHQVVVTQFA